ncbi:MAG TPA: adenylosuccinate lyase [Anaerolineae bacterium]|nr:adenylosuccinate lyase [Anaerolineae bacterium]
MDSQGLRLPSFVFHLSTFCILNSSFHIGSFIIQPSAFSLYQSPFSWRYGSDALRSIWSELHKRRLWRRIWIALAEAQAQLGLVTPEQVADLRAHADQIDLDRAHQIESDIKHDLMAELKTYAEQCPIGGGILHLGATSMDIEDNADALRLRESLDLLIPHLHSLLHAFAAQIETWADTPTMAFTHLQPAEPTTIGYRLAQYAQDLLIDYAELTRVRRELKGKGFKGAVGTSASYIELLPPPFHGDGVETLAMRALDLEPFEAATQTYPRKQDWLVLNALAGLAMSLHKFAFDLRFLQSPPIGEWAEPFAARQVGSSAMPFKRNPVNAEKIDSLARYLAQLPRIAWDDAANSLLERTLDDSANRRIILPEAFLCADELLITAQKLIDGLRIDTAAIARNFAAYAPFAATERLLMAAVKAGADRQALHEVIREQALAAWAEVAAGRPNPLIDALCADPYVARFLDTAQARALLDARAYVGDAPARARQTAAKIRALARSTTAGELKPRGSGSS